LSRWNFGAWNFRQAGDVTTLATIDPRLEGMDFEQLAARAELQRSKVEECRLEIQHRPPEPKD